MGMNKHVYLKVLCYAVFFYFEHLQQIQKECCAHLCSSRKWASTFTVQRATHLLSLHLTAMS